MNKNEGRKVNQVTSEAATAPQKHLIRTENLRDIGVDKADERDIVP